MQLLKTYVLFCFLILLISAKPAREQVAKTRWMSLQDVSINLQKVKKPVLIDLYTDWCGWCKVMDKQTYADKNVSSYLAEKFYAAKVNAESKQSISWNNRTFAFNPQYKTNDFAIFLTGGRLSYPTTVIIPPDGGAPQAIPGFLKPKEIESILKYFGEGAHKKMPFDQFYKGFKSSW